MVNNAKLNVYYDTDSIKTNPEFMSGLVMEGTHVRCLPNGEYLKKHWNMISYVAVKSDGSYYLHDMSFVGKSNKRRLSKCGIYSSVFKTNAIPGIHFEWLEHGVVYDQFKNELRKY